MNVIFFGSSDFSIPALEACLESIHSVVCVITTPDKKKGRGLKETPTPVGLFCHQHRIPVEAPETTKDPVLFEKIKGLKPDIFVVSSYGKMIPSPWLQLPACARLNVHPSLLPKYRGAAPIQWPVILGDPVTGISIIDITDTLDAGDIFYQKEIPLDSQIDAEALASTLSNFSREALRDVFEKIARGNLERKRQNEQEASYARKLKKNDGLIDWTRPAADLHNLIRGLIPWPAAYAQWAGGPVQILKSHVIHPDTLSHRPGKLLEIHKQGYLSIQTGKGILGIDTVRPAGKKEMHAADFARGRRFETGRDLSLS